MIDIKTVENIENNKSQTLINEYLENGNLLKPKQIESLLINDFYMADSLSKNSQVMAECSLFLTNRSNFIKYKEIPNEFYS